jgi:ribose 5-phosphate isomerase B
VHEELLMSDPLRVVIGSDSAGMQYKELIKADLLADPRVAEVIDVGVGPEENTAYPYVAVDAARKIAEGGWLSQRTRFRVSGR